MAKQKSDNGETGKLIDTWVYEYQGITDYANGPEGQTRKKVEPKKVEVELRLLKKFKDSDEPPLAIGAVKFLVRNKDLGIKLEGTDIEALRTAMWDKLDEKFRVKWERYYLVRIEPDRPFDAIGTGFTFGYNWVEKGTAWDGTLLLREHRRYDPETIELWPGEVRGQEGKVLACIPETTENSQALREFADRIDDLREKLAAYLKPDVIQHTLANLNGNSLLPLPAPKQKGEKEPAE